MGTYDLIAHARVLGQAQGQGRGLVALLAPALQTQAYRVGVGHPAGEGLLDGRLKLAGPIGVEQAQQGELPPPLPLTLPDDPRVRDQAVRPHALGNYDHITTHPEAGDDEPA